MTYLVTANKPAKSDAERAEEMMREFDDWDKVEACAESWLKDGYVAVKVWKLHIQPVLQTIVSWEQDND